MNRPTMCVAALMLGGAVIESSAVPSLSSPNPVVGTLLMEISESGKTITDTFEIWAVSGTVSPMRPGETSPITLTTLVFSQATAPRTMLMVEPHETLSVEEVQHGLFRIRFSGNGKACSDLEAIVHYSADYTRLLELEGSARGGFDCEHVYTYKVSRDATRAIPALVNGVFLAFPSFSPSKEQKQLK